MTILWIVGITNAVNLIDGLDGLAVGVSSIAAITMLAVALLTENMMIAVTMAALAGACVGFMPYNLNPAKDIYGGYWLDLPWLYAGNGIHHGPVQIFMRSFRSLFRS